MKKNEVIKKCMDVIILNAQLNVVAQRKHSCVMQQKYEEAADILKIEATLRSQMPTLEELQKLRDKL